MASTYYEGRVHTIMFEDAAEAFYILKVRLEDESPLPGMPSLAGDVTVRGHIPGMKIEVNSWLGFEAKWTRHPKFGKQLLVTKAPVLKNGWNADTAEKMLSSNGISAPICTTGTSMGSMMIVKTKPTGIISNEMAIPIAIKNNTANHDAPLKPLSLLNDSRYTCQIGNLYLASILLLHVVYPRSDCLPTMTNTVFFKSIQFRSTTIMRGHKK